MKTILLVEDDDDIRELVAELLREKGYEVIEAENGRLALDYLEQVAHHPCLVLLDLMMPVMSGVQLLNALHDSHRLAALPVVVLSAGGQPQDVPEEHRFLRKPATPELILAVVREFCS